MIIMLNKLYKYLKKIFRFGAEMAITDGTVYCIKTEGWKHCKIPI